MTVADPKFTRQRRSWRAHLRAGTDPLTRSSSLLAATSAPWTFRRHKPLDDLADLLHMSTVDPKAPADTPGSADLLEALVRTERTTPALPPDEIAPLEEPQLTDALPERTGRQPKDSDEAQVNLLQREIETLLRDTPELAPGESTLLAPLPTLPPREELASSAVAEELALDEGLQSNAGDEIRAVAQSQEVQAPSAPRAEVTQAELDVLLTPEAEPAAAAAFVAPSASGPSVADPAPIAESLPADASREDAEPATHNISKRILAEQLDALIASTPFKSGDQTGVSDVLSDEDAHEKLTEAEGVLAEELAQLISESHGPPAAPSTSPANAVAPSAATPEPEPASAGAIAGQTAGDFAAPAAIAAAPAYSDAPHAESTLNAAAEEEQHPAQPKGLLGKMRRLANNVVLMVLQILDLPFGWMQELDKNAVGVAAFMLLLGGIVLFIAARITGH